MRRNAPHWLFALVANAGACAPPPPATGRPAEPDSHLDVQDVDASSTEYVQTSSALCGSCADCSGSVSYREPNGRLHSCCYWMDFDCSEDDGSCAICIEAEPCDPQCCGG